jgi:hypothetical protein
LPKPAQPDARLRDRAPPMKRIPKSDSTHDFIGIRVAPGATYLPKTAART